MKWFWMQRVVLCLTSVLFTIALSAQEPPAPPPPLPQIFAPGDLVLSNDHGHCYATGLILATPIARDYAGGHTISCTRDDGQLIAEPFPTGTTILTWTITDAAGQTATTTQAIKVNDTEPLEIKAPPDVEVTADDGCLATKVDEGEPKIKSCPGLELEIIAHRSDGEEFRIKDKRLPYPTGITVVRWTVSDRQERQTSALQRIVVKDSKTPRIEAPPDVVTNTEPGRCAAFINVGTPKVFDVCSPDAIETIRSDGKRRLDMPFAAGRTTIVWIATNGSGQRARAEQNIVVNDTEGPVIGNLITSTKELWPPNQRMVGVKVGYRAEDVCGGAVTTSLSVTSSEPDRSPQWDIINDHFIDLRAERAGNVERVYTIQVKAVDAHGNESVKTATVTVRPPA